VQKQEARERVCLMLKGVTARTWCCE